MNFSEKIIDGKKIAADVNRETAMEVAAITKDFGARPGLAVVLVGDNPASKVYVSSKVKRCAELGIYSEKIVLPKETSQAELLQVIAKLNVNPLIHGILVQSPVPKHIDEQAVVNAINPDKDVDCFHARNVGRLLLGDFSGFLPCTPWGVMQLLKRSEIPTAGKHAVIIGRSNIVGKPMMALLSAKGADATVTLCHSRTPDIAAFTRNADLIVAAVGKPEFLRGNMVKDGAVIIDVGINRVEAPGTEKGYRLVGDVAFDEVAPKASRITPVPGGVGPMTIAMLMKNTVRAFHLALKH
ncbi:MAG: bifunctional methylenetetrahydrofolate dehydrogenase/methenyltetrahydrofolate cyclohydrolase FolD [Lentisphaerae bacterium]|nr:bifunctional methylenetetrahydrofolate dehydrogenase/methenyltetrahydrofolate cyclohydrolase FolD [Lentisphaerota bacterium]